MKKDCFEESQALHGFFAKKHLKKVRFDKLHLLYARYHEMVLDVQRSRGKILPYAERKKIFQKCEINWRKKYR